MTQTLVATTARTVTFSHDGEIRTFPAGTEVYVRIRSNGRLRLRVPGTLYTQDVYPATVNIP